MSDLNDEAIIAENSTEDSDVTETSVEESATDSAEKSDAVSQDEAQNAESNEDAFDYLEETKPSQAEVDAQNLFNKMASMTKEQKEAKLKALESRPQTLEALKALMSDDTVESAVAPEPEEDLSDRAYIERARFHSGIEDFVARNNLPDEVLKELKNPVGEVSLAFRKMQFDPETGEKLTFNQKLKYALLQSDAVNNALSEVRAEAKARGTLKATAAKLRNGGGGSTKIDLDELKDSNPAEYLKALDEATGVGSRFVG